MRKGIFLFLILFLFCTTSFASEAQRKMSSGRKTSNEVIKASSGTVYDIEVIATANAGYAVIFDCATKIIAGETELAEIREATQYNSKHVSFGDGIKAYKGISLYLHNAEAIIYYY